MVWVEAVESSPAAGYMPAASGLAAVTPHTTQPGAASISWLLSAHVRLDMTSQRKASVEGCGLCGQGAAAARSPAAEHVSRQWPSCCPSSPCSPLQLP